MKQVFTMFFALGLFSCQQENKPQSSTNQPPSSKYIENVSVILSVQKTDEQRIPDFSWYDHNGKQISFAEFSKGKPVLINFWATWCGPCIAETPDLVALNEEYSEKGALVIGISEDKDADALDLVSQFTKEYKMTYPIVIDNGDLEEALGGLRGYPTTFLIDKNGKIVKKMLGLQSKEKFTREFNAVL